MNADPFEVEHLLLPDTKVLTFAPRALELPLEELVRLMAFDVVGQIPRANGGVEERVGENGAGFLFQSLFFQIGPSTLGIATEIDEGVARHRVLELLGLGGDVRARVCFSLLRDAASRDGLPRSARDALAQGRSLGQVRLYHGEPTGTTELRRALTRGLVSAGVDPQALPGAELKEPEFHPPAHRRLALELPPADIKVAGDLLGILALLPVDGQMPRPPRRIGHHQERVRREDGTIVSWRFETHRGATGIVFLRRRDVEAGLERPGLVRTFVVAGLKGATRLRVREVSGRAVAEVAGARAAVDTVAEALERLYRARPA